MSKYIYYGIVLRPFPFFLAHATKWRISVDESFCSVGEKNKQQSTLINWITMPHCSDTGHDFMMNNIALITYDLLIAIISWSRFYSYPVYNVIIGHLVRDLISSTLVLTWFYSYPVYNVIIGHLVRDLISSTLVLTNSI